MKAIVYPIVIGKNFREPDPPLSLDRASKGEAILALFDSGYCIKWTGGFFDVTTVTAEELRDSQADSPHVRHHERALGYALPDGARIVKYLVSVCSS
jgi:hypothetical protein